MAEILHSQVKMFYGIKVEKIQILAFSFLFRPDFRVARLQHKQRYPDE